MSVSKIILQEKTNIRISSKTLTEESEENYPDNYRDYENEDRYVREKCIHDSCDKKTVIVSDTEINFGIAEDAGGDEYIDLEGTDNKGLDKTLDTSDFTDTECGEPMKSQFLKIDFTPIDGIDDDPHLQKKCSDFWEFIRSQPQLQRLMVIPEKDYKEDVAASSSEISIKKCEHIQPPAVVEWLETGVGQKLAFSVKHQSKYCHHYNGDYMDEVSPPKNRETGRAKSADRGTLQTTAEEIRRFSALNAADLCTQLDKWDQEHPKSMDPPGRAPSLKHAVLQSIKQEG